MNLLANKKTSTIILLFTVFLVWRGLLLFFIPASNAELWNSSAVSFWWGGLYQLIAIVGGIMGLIIAKHWGGLKSILGRSISAISLGLLLQAFGQTIATYYVFYNVDALYPSIADIGFFGSVLLYIYGATCLLKVTGVKFSLKSFSNKAQAVVIPSILLIASYFVFLKGYEFDWSSPARIFLDFGYPLGQALYVSLALMILVLSRQVLGGIMRTPVIFLLIAFIFQYFSDYMFLYQSSHETYIAGGSVDFMYMVSYFLMSLSLIELGSIFNKIKNS